ncbi:MAG: P63C domain-containing protein [Rhodovibrio sp.]|nr:P63C domain-containing protein [Rhodovibrio sp.]
MTDNGIAKSTGRSKGGSARASALSPEKRSEIARKAAKARWGLKATHKGNFYDELGLDIDCYVLDDENKTPVVSQRGMGTALGFSEGGSRLPRFLSRKAISAYVGPELREKLENPIVFQAPNPGPKATVHGHDVGILIDLCKAILQAERAGALHPRQAPIAKQAAIISSASAKLGIRDLVYALSGYDQTREETIKAFKVYVAEEAREYEKEFPDQLYMEWYRLYQIEMQSKGKPWKFKHLTVHHVYWPLARSNGRILELTRAQKSQSQDRRKKLHQFMSDVGVKALRQHLGQLLGIAQISDTREEYETNVQKVFGDQHQLRF